MSVEVSHIPVDPGESFSEVVPTEQRPPVPGEENVETASNDGCGSHHSNITIITKPELTRSPAATPRRSNIDHGKLTQMLQYHGQRGVEDMDAPLGFEPEGSASVTPPYTRWAESFRALLDDSEGINLFREFLQQEKDEDSLLFWFACQGFKNKPASDPTRGGTGKVIYKNFIKLNGPQTVKLSEHTRNYIAQYLNRTAINQGLFDQAQAEIEDLMRETTYPMFLKSEIYVQYVQNGGLSSPKCESSSSSSTSRYPTDYLPTVHEDSELCCDVKSTTSESEKQVPLTSKMLQATRYTRMGITTEHQKREGRYLQGTSAKVISPYHASLLAHAPATSTNDSELQSLSSDAISDDTMSLTDSSVDGFPTTRRWEQKRRREMRQMHTNVRQNGRITSFPPFPHSQRRPKEVQPMEPKEFAALLTRKLEDYLKQLESSEKLDARMRKLELEEEEEKQHLFIPSSAPMVKTLPTEPAKKFAAAVSDNDTTSGVEEDPNSIIEEHFSRVFDSSGRHTPHGYWSPGRHTPKSKSPDRTLRKVSSHGAPSLPATVLHKLTHQQQLHKSRHHRDSNHGTEYMIYDTETGMQHHHKHHHHHHVHHHNSSKTKHQIETEATQRSMAVFGVDPAEQTYNPKSRAHQEQQPMMETTVLESSRHKRDGKKSSKKSDASVTSKATSGVDSGIFEGAFSLPPSDSGSEKYRNRAIMDWIQESEEFTRHQQQQYADLVSKTRETRHKRPQHKLPSQSPSQSPHRIGTSKKQPVIYSASRPTSVERPYNVQQAWIKNKPAQPIMQDPSMPINTPPDPLSVLEEARRRIDDEKKLKHPKTKHQSDTSRKDRRPSASATQSLTSSRSMTSTPKNVPPEMTSVESAEDELRLQQSSNNSTMKKSSRSSKSTSTSIRDADNTVVAYFFCSEPIPYRTSVVGKEITLAHFKSLITKKGNYQYVFKKASDEFECGVVHEIISDDSAILPIFEGKIVGKVEKID